MHFLVTAPAQRKNPKVEGFGIAEPVVPFLSRLSAVEAVEGRGSVEEAGLDRVAHGVASLLLQLPLRCGVTFGVRLALRLPPRWGLLVRGVVRLTRWARVVRGFRRPHRRGRVVVGHARLALRLKAVPL